MFLVKKCTFVVDEGNLLLTLQPRISQFHNCNYGVIFIIKKYSKLLIVEGRSIEISEALRWGRDL